MVSSIVVIALLFFRAIDDHITCINDFFNTVKVEMGFAGSNVEDLIVNSATGTVGRKFWFCNQTIGTATSNKQSVFFVFEVKRCV